MKDSMPTWLLKTCIDLIAPYIASLFNLSLSSGIVPTSYKDAYVIPRLKKPTLPCGDLSNYRPISNLPFLSKLLERVVSVQLSDYLSSAGLLPVHQSAYRKLHSTETTLLKVVTDLIEASDAGDHALLGLLDLSAAFDTVDHDVLVDRLARTYGLRSTALDWLRSYLYSIADNPFFTTEFHHRFVVSSAGSHRVRCWGRCYSCSIRQTLVSWLPVSACHLNSTPTTCNFIRGVILHLLDCSGAGWSWELSRSRSGYDLIDSVLILRRRSFFGPRPADGVPIWTPRSSVSAVP